MRHRKKEIKIYSRPGHRRMLLRNLASSLLFYEKVETTSAKARLLRPYVEKLITSARQDNLAGRRRALKKLAHKNAVKKLFEVIGPRYKDRRGGYLRIIKTRFRPGDRADLSRVSLI